MASSGTSRHSSVRLRSRLVALSLSASVVAACTSHDQSAGWSMPTHRLVSKTQQTGFRIEGPVSTSTDSLARFRSDVDRLVRLHQQWVRYDVPSWDVAPQGSAARIAWSGAALHLQEEAVRYAKGRGLHVMIVTSGAPDWSSTLSPEDYLSACRRYWTGLRDALAPYVDVWQVFNEADTTDYRTFHTARLSPGYLHALGGALQTAHDVFGAGSSPRPVTTNATGWPCDESTARRWVSYFTALAPHLDIVSVDAYPGTDKGLAQALPGHLADLRRVTGKVVYVTEFGLQTRDGNSEDDQASAYVTALQSLSTSSAPVLIAYELRDGDRSHGPEGFGVLTQAGQPKKALSVVEKALAPSS